MNYTFFHLFIIAHLLTSCSIEESANFINIDERIQNEGYFPLSQSNSWVYEYRTGVEKDSTTFLYDRDSILVEKSINSTELIELDGKKRFDYSFLPINLGTTFGAFIPSLYKVTKNENEYKKIETLLIPDQYFSGGSKYKLSLRLESQKFLVDDPQIDQVISSKSDVFRSPDGAFEIHYTYSTKVVGFLEKMPEKYSSVVGIDDQLQKYKDILHTRDVLFLNKIVANENAENRLNVSMKIRTKKGSTFSLNNISTTLDGYGWVYGLSFIPIYATTNDMAITEFTQPLEICQSQANININTELKGGTIELISNQEIYNLDQYWVKGVGNIKSISSYKDIMATVNLKNYLSTDPFLVDFITDESDTECLNKANTVKLAIKIKTEISGLEVKIPIKLSNSSKIIQNLKSYTHRKTLN